MVGAAEGVAWNMLFEAIANFETMIINFGHFASSLRINNSILSYAYGIVACYDCIEMFHCFFF